MSAKTASAHGLLKLVKGDFDQQPEGDFPPPIPEGRYDLRLIGYSTQIAFKKSAKLILDFMVLDLGPSHGRLVSRYYNVDRLIGGAGKSGRFVPPKRGDFMLEFLTLFPDHVPNRLDRISLAPMFDRIIRGEVRTVRQNNVQRLYPKPLQYSVVGKLIKVKND